MRAGTANKPIRSVAFVSLGCPKNLVDSERMLGLLAEDGLAITPDAGSNEVRFYLTRSPFCSSIDRHFMKSAGE